MARILIIEPFYGGSHKQMIDTIIAGLPDVECTLITMTAKKWPWRARCSALYISQKIPDISGYETVFCSSVLSLSELIGLKPEIAKLRKVVYFHENQLVYPVQRIKERDFQYGYNQITTCLSADVVIFNSEFNRTSFLENIKKFLKIMPEYRPNNIVDQIAHKTKVIYFPIDYTGIDLISKENRLSKNEKRTLHLVWPHRWEFDKNPLGFFNALYTLLEKKIDFRVSMLGQSFSQELPEFKTVLEKMNDKIVHFGYIESKQKYYEVLLSADVVVSTAIHEFFGVSVLEAVHCGCLPLVPNKLVYPEHFPAECLYDSDEALHVKLALWCQNSHLVTQLKNKLKIDTEKFSAEKILPTFLSLLLPPHTLNPESADTTCLFQNRLQI